MQNSVAKKVFAVGIAASTILWTLAPLAAQAAVHAAGTNINASGTVYMVTSDGARRAYTSAGAFLSYGFNSFASLVAASAEDLALPVGSFIPPQDGSIICSDRAPDKGTCYLVTGGQKAGFTSAAVFTGLGFSFSNAKNGDASWMGSASGLIDDTVSAHLPGVLVNNNGTVELVGTTGLLGIPDLATFNSWGYSFKNVVPANAADKAMSLVGVMAARVAGQLSPSFTTGGTGTGTTNPPPVSGTVSVTAGAQASAANVPLKATNVPLVKFMVNNGNGTPVTVDQITVHRSGAGAPGDWANVYLYNGSSRLTSGRTINSSTNDVVMSGLNITVPANGSVTLDVLGSVGTSGTGDVHTFVVTSVMMGGTQATGTVAGNQLTIAGVSAGTLAVTKSGTIANPKVGQTNVRVASFQLAASSAEDQTIRRISLYQGGTVSASNITNFKLEQAGNVLATASVLDSKGHANFDLSFPLAKGDQKTFEVYADIGGGARTGTSETVLLYLEENSDVYSVGSTYGFGATVGIASTDTPVGSYGGASCAYNVGTNCSNSYIEGGQLTITFNGPASYDIAKNGKAVELFNFTMAAQNNLEVRGIQFLFNGGGGTANFNDGTTANYTNVKIVDTATNQVVWGPQDLSTAASASTTETSTFTEYVNLSAGTSKTYKLVADVANNSAVINNDPIEATLVTSYLTSNKVKNIDNNTFLTASDIVPTGSVSGNKMTVKTATVAVALAGTPASKSFVKGSNAVPAAGFVFTASTAKDIKVTDLTLTGMIASSATDTLTAGATTNSTGGALNVSDDVVTVSLWDGTTQVGQTKSPAVTTGLATFNSLNWTVPAGTSKTLTVQMNVSSNAGTNNYIKWQIGAGAVTAVDPDGNSVIETGGNTTIPAAAKNSSSSLTAGTAITISGTGTLAVTSAGTEQGLTDNRIVDAGQTAVTLGKMKFTVSNEDLKLTKVRVNVASINAAAASISSAITALYLYDGATQVAVANGLTPSGATEAYANFSSISPDVVVPANDGNGKVLTVKADLNTISGGAKSGQEFRVWLDTTNNFEARGVVGNTDITASGSNFTGSYFGNFVVLRRSQPKVELVSLPSGTKLQNGTNVLLRFKVTAVDGTVSLKHISFTTSTGTGVTVLTPAISEQSGSNIGISATASTTPGSGSVKFDVTFTSEEVITTSKTYDFKANVTLSGQTNYSVATSIAATDSDDTTGPLGSLTGQQTVIDADQTNLVGDATDAGAHAYNFIWSDVSATSHNDTPTSGSADWTNGRYVKTLPTDAQGLSY